MSTDCIERLKIDLGHASDDSRIARDVLQPDCRRPVNAEVGWEGEVVSAHPAESEVAHQRRIEHPGQANGYTLGSIQIRAERIVERAFRPEVGRAKRVRVYEAVTASSYLLPAMIDSHIELVLSRCSCGVEAKIVVTATFGSGISDTIFAPTGSRRLAGITH